jgi:hypothetical protein
MAFRRRVRAAIESKQILTLIVTNSPTTMGEYVIREGLDNSRTFGYSDLDRALANAQWAEQNGITARVIVLPPDGGTS